MRFALLVRPIRTAAPIGPVVHENFFEALRTALNVLLQMAKPNRVVLSRLGVSNAAMDTTWTGSMRRGDITSQPRRAKTSGLAGGYEWRNGSKSMASRKSNTDVMGTFGSIDLALVIEDGAMTYLVLIETKGVRHSRHQLASNYQG